MTSLAELGARLVANVQAGRSDFAPSTMKIPAEHYRDPARFAKELEAVFRRNPVMVALRADIPNPGDFTAIELAGRPIVVVRGADGVARTFLNACRHRGRAVVDECFGSSRRLTCPYHAWVYDTDGTLVGVPGEVAFDDLDGEGLIEFPTEERAGAIFAVLTVGASFDIDDWLGDMLTGLEMLDLENLYRHDVETSLPSGNWKGTADGYVDGYHLGYLHAKSIGVKSITNRNTYDLWGPHVRIGFANKPILEHVDIDPAEWPDNYTCFSLVHFVFPNVSISGHPDRSLMVSRIHPGPTPDACTVTQYQYFREPLADEQAEAEAEAKRQLYERVTYEEDFLTVLSLTNRSDALAEQGESFRFGRNEMGNQNIHEWIDKLVSDLPGNS